MDKGRRAVSYVPKLKGYIDNYYMKYFSDMDVREIMPVHIKEWYLNLPDRSPKTIKNICDALRNFFNGFHADRIIERELLFPSIEIAEHEPECLSPEVQMMILDKIPEVHKPIYAFMFFQGCRPGEARALKWDCINEDIVTYKRTFSTNKLVEHTKTKKIRYNLLFPETLAILPPRGFPLDFVFSHGKHRKSPYGENMLNYTYRAAVKKVNDEGGLIIKWRRERDSNPR